MNRRALRRLKWEFAQQPQHMSQPKDEAVILKPKGPHSATVIWLHGLGADGNDFVPVVDELGLPANHGIKFIFPHAGVRPVTINNGYPMRAWYDILTLSRLDKNDEAGIRDSAARITALLDAEMAAGIPSTRLLLAGFSQGCAMALFTGLRYAHPLAGLLALSGYLPMHTTLPAEASDANRRTPILMMHGRQDPVVPHALGNASRELLQGLGYALDWREYNMQHQVCGEQIADIAVWLKARLA